MANIKAKIIEATINDKNIAQVTLELEDSKGKWIKHYSYSQSRPVTFTEFKDRVVSDLRNDLKIKDELVNIKKEVGKEFTITI